jgi:xanthine dehydrogenase FAD-binding subunit
MLCRRGPGLRGEGVNEVKYLRPRSLEQALIALAEWGDKGRILAGGTDLLIAMRRGAIQPEVIVDITCLDELRGIHRNDELISIGAMSTHREIQRSLELARSAPLLVNACRDIGSVQIRNLGTIGGNLGNASPAGDTIPAFYVLEAEINLVSLKGDRWVNVADFFLDPGKTTRKPDEIIKAVRFHPLEETWKTFFVKIGQRRALRVAKISAAGALNLEGDRVHGCRLALGAVAPTVIRLRSAEEALIGGRLDPGRINKTADIAASTCSPINDIRSTIEYRRAMARVLIRRELLKISNEVKFD